MKSRFCGQLPQAMVCSPVKKKKKTQPQHHSSLQLKCLSPANARRLPNVGSVLVQRRRRWANIEPTLGERLVFAGPCTMCTPCKHETLSQCWIDVGSASQTVGQYQTNIDLTFDLTGFIHCDLKTTYSIYSHEKKAVTTSTIFKSSKKVSPTIIHFRTLQWYK